MRSGAKFPAEHFRFHLQKYLNSVSCEFDKFRVDTHLRKSCVIHRPPVFSNLSSVKTIVMMDIKPAMNHHDDIIVSGNMENVIHCSKK